MISAQSIPDPSLFTFCFGVSQSFFTFSSAVSQFKSTSPQVKQCQIQTARRPVSHETGISKVIIPASDPMAARCLGRDCLFKSGRDFWSKLSCLDVVTVANIFLELGTKSLKQHMTVSDYKLETDSMRTNTLLPLCLTLALCLPACLPLYNAADYRAAPRGWAAYQFSGSQMCDVRELCKAHNGLPSTCSK